MAVTLVFVRTFADFIVTIVVALVLAILLTPFLGWLQRKGMPKALAFILTMAVVVALMVFLFLFFVLSLSQLGAAIPVYAAELEDLKLQIQALLATAGIELADSQSMMNLMQPGQIVDLFARLFSAVSGVLSDGLTVLLMLAFTLIGASSFSARARQLMDEGHPGLGRLFQFNQDIRHYLFITNNVGLAAAAINTALLLVVGVDFALLWGVLSYLLSYVPYVGFVLALVPPVVLALLEFGWPTAVFVFIAYFVINSAIDEVVKPRLLGQGLDLAPVIVFVSVILWGLILGPLGGLLAVPVTLAIKQLLIESDPDNRWLARLIGNGDGQAAAETAVVSPSPPSSKP
ncbi:MAG: AI-2E family transporter [Chloroflexota bacterium]